MRDMDKKFIEDTIIEMMDENIKQDEISGGDENNRQKLIKKILDSLYDLHQTAYEKYQDCSGIIKRFIDIVKDPIIRDRVNIDRISNETENDENIVTFKGYLKSVSLGAFLISLTASIFVAGAFIGKTIKGECVYEPLQYFLMREYLLIRLDFIADFSRYNIELKNKEVCFSGIMEHYCGSWINLDTCGKKDEAIKNFLDTYLKHYHPNNIVHNPSVSANKKPRGKITNTFNMPKTNYEETCLKKLFKNFNCTEYENSQWSSENTQNLDVNKKIVQGLITALKKEKQNKTKKDKKNIKKAIKKLELLVDPKQEQQKRKKDNIERLKQAQNKNSWRMKIRNNQNRGSKRSNKSR
jgi:hypothetical protein